MIHVAAYVVNVPKKEPTSCGEKKRSRRRWSCSNLRRYTRQDRQRVVVHVPGPRGGGHQAGQGAADASTMRDLIVRTLATGATSNIATWQTTIQQGRLAFAFTVDAATSREWSASGSRPRDARDLDHGRR